MNPKQEGSPINIIIADHDVNWMNDAAEDLGTHPQIKVLGFARDGQKLIQMATNMMADAIFMDYSLPDITASEVAKRLAEDSPGTLIFTTTYSLTAQLVQTAKAVGIVEVFPKDQMVMREVAGIIANEVDNKRREWTNLSESYGTVEKGIGPKGEKIRTEYVSHAITQTIVLTYNTKGGVGKSTTAINIASAIKASPLLSGQRVALVDFDCGSANVATICHVADSDAINRNLAMWEHCSRDLSASEVDEMLIPGPHGLMIAAAPLNPAMAERINNDLADKILSILRRHFGIIIIDGAPNISPAVDEAINHATHILLIATPEGQSVKQLSKLVSLLKPDEEYPDKKDMSHILRKMFVVVNHIQPASKWDLQTAKLASIIGRPIIAEIPYSETVKQALHGNEKKQAVDIDPANEFSLAIKSLTNDLCGAYPEVSGIGKASGYEMEALPNNKGGFFGLFKRKKRR